MEAKHRREVGKQFFTFKGKKNRRDKDKAGRKEKMMHFNYERIGSDDGQDQEDDVLKFGKIS